MATTETDKNRFIAEKLEPEPTPVVQLWGYPLSPKKMWSYESDGGDREHRIFDEDPAAMVALIEAIMPKGFMFSVLAQDNHYTVLFSHENGKDGGKDSDSSLMLAVREAAYKALGGE